MRRHDGKSRYRAFVDPSGGRHDAFALCVGHSIGYGQEKTFTCDVIRARRPPFDPREVVAEYAALLKEFGLSSVTGDRYSAEWVASAFEEHGVTYEPAEKSKSDLYLEALPLFTRGAISIPNYAPLVRELRLLERQTHRGGRDTVDHPRRGSDDLANALCGCAALCSKRRLRHDLRLGRWRGPARLARDPARSVVGAHHEAGAVMLSCSARASGRSNTALRSACSIDPGSELVQLGRPDRLELGRSPRWRSPLQPQWSAWAFNKASFASDVPTAVIGEPFDRAIDASEAMLDGGYIRSRTPSPRMPHVKDAHSLAIAATECKGNPPLLSVVAADLEPSEHQPRLRLSSIKWAIVPPLNGD